jgi:hypothetical protein
MVGPTWGIIRSHIRQDENLRLPPVRRSSITIITLDKKDFFSKKKGGEIQKVGKGQPFIS